MTRKRPRTVSIADDDRARVPFAVIAVLLLVSSIAIVGVLETRDEPETNTDESLALDRAEATTQAEIRNAVVRATEQAARAPLTETTDDTAVGRAIEAESGDSDERFRNYVRLLIYTEVVDSLENSEQAIGTELRANAAIEEIDWDDEREVRNAISAIELDRGDDNTLTVTVHGVDLTVTDGEEELTGDRRDVTVTIGTPLFELHDRTEEYQEEIWMGMGDFGADMLDEGFTRDFAWRMYAYTWGKAYLQRFTPDQQFDEIVNLDHTEVLKNDALYATQERVFGDSDRYSDRAISGPQTCMAVDLMQDILDLEVDWSDDEDEDSDSDSTGDGDSGTDSSGDSEPDSSGDEDSDSDSTDAEDAGVDTDGWLDGVDQSLEDLITGLCGSESVFGDVEGEIKDPPSMSKILKGLLNAPSTNRNIEVNLHPYADAGFVETTAENWFDGNGNNDLEDRFNETLYEHESGEFTADYLETHFANSDEIGVDNEDADAYDADDIDDAISDIIGDAQDENDVEEIIEDVFTVEYDPDRLSSSGESFPSYPSAPSSGHWVTTSSETTISNEDADVSFDVIGHDSGDGPDASPLVEIDIEYEQEVTRERSWAKLNATGFQIDTASDSNTETVTYDATYEIDADFSPDIEVAEWPGVEYLDESGGDTDRDADNFDGVENEALRYAFDTRFESTLESRIESAGKDEEIRTESDFLAAIDATEASYTDDETFQPTGSDRDELEAWLTDELGDTHVELITSVDPIETTVLDLATGETSLLDLKDRVDDERHLIHADRGATYANTHDVARAQVRHTYFENVNDKIESMAGMQGDGAPSLGNGITNEFGTLLDAGDSLLEGPLEFIQDILTGEEELTDHETDPIESAVMDDVRYEVDASPTYMPMEPVERSDVPSVRNRGGTITDTDDGTFPTAHAPMAGATVDIFGHPGFPLLPHPMLYFLNIDVWLSWTMGEYTRFEVRANSGDPTKTDGTNYVREDKDVYIEPPESHDESEIHAGSVDPIKVHQILPIPIVVPSSKFPIPGKPGVGDDLIGGTERFRCSETAPLVGPFPADIPSPRDGAACLETPDEEQWLERWTTWGDWGSDTDGP